MKLLKEELWDDPIKEIAYPIGWRVEQQVREQISWQVHAQVFTQVNLQVFAQVSR